MSTAPTTSASRIAATVTLAVGNQVNGLRRSVDGLGTSPLGMPAPSGLSGDSGMFAFLRDRGVSDGAGHHQADVLTRDVGTDEAHDASVEHDCDAVGKGKDLVELGRYDDDGGA